MKTQLELEGLSVPPSCIAEEETAEFHPGSLTDPDFSSTGLVLSPLYPFYRNLFFFFFYYERCFHKLAVGGS